MKMGDQRTVQIDFEDIDIVEELGGPTKAMRKGLEALRTMREIEEGKKILVELYPPDWTFEKASTEKRLYILLLSLTEDPKREDIAKFWYDRYRNPEIFRAFVDQRSPFYIEYVASALSGRFKLSEVEDDIAKLEMRRSDLQNSINNSEKEKEKIESEIDELTLQIDPKKLEIEELQRMIGNFYNDELVSSLNEHFSNLSTIFTEILKVSGGNEAMSKTKLIDRSALDKIRTLSKSSDDLQKKLKEDDFLKNPDLLDDLRKKRLNEMINTQTMIESVVSMNPERRIRKVINGITLVLEQIEKVRGDIFRDSAYGVISSNLTDIGLQAEKLMEQFENVKRRKEMKN